MTRPIPITMIGINTSLGGNDSVVDEDEFVDGVVIVGTGSDVTVNEVEFVNVISSVLIELVITSSS